MQSFKKFLDNPSIRHINEPVTLFFSYVDADKFDYYEQNKHDLANLKSSCKEQLTSYLKREGYCVVTDDNPLAANPSTMVVSESGIQTPFLNQKKINLTAERLLSDIADSKFALPRSYVLAVRLEQLPPPVLSSTPETAPFKHLRHPNQKLLEDIHYLYGRDFFKNMYRRAWSWGEETTERLKQSFNLKDLSQPLYSGRGLAVEPFYCYARNDLESRYLVFATADYAYAAKYCCHKEQQFGFIHNYQKSPLQPFYDDCGIERGWAPERKKAFKLETMVVPGVNRYLYPEMFMQERTYIIPSDDEMWKVFLEYYRAGYMPRNDNPYLIQRRLNVLTEANQNGGIAVCHLPFGLNPDELLALNRLEISTPARTNFAHAIDNMTQQVKNLKNTSLCPSTNENNPTGSAPFEPSAKSRDFY